MSKPIKPIPVKPAALEKIPVAAHRMGCSTSQAYREIKAGRLGPLVKLGARASAVPAEAVDTWIAARIAETQGVVQTPNIKLGVITKAAIIPDLADGEHYAGLILTEDGQPLHHVILLPGETEATWQKAIDWAASIGGELPSRREQSLLFANAKQHFQRDWYWSSEQHASNANYAWNQYFNDGSRRQQER